MLGVRLIALVLFILPLAGCASDTLLDQGGAGAGKLSVVSVDTYPSGPVEVGETITVNVRVANSGQQAATGTVVMVDQSSIGDVKTIQADGGSTTEASLTYIPRSRGSMTLVLKLDGNQVGQVPIKAVGPLFSEYGWDYEDLWCTDRVPVSVNFMNSGDGPARSVVVTFQIFNENNVEQDRKSVNIGDVAAGERGAAQAELFSRDTCGRDDYYYVTMTMTPAKGDSGSTTTQRFSI